MTQSKAREKAKEIFQHCLLLEKWPPTKIPNSMIDTLASALSNLRNECYEEAAKVAEMETNFDAGWGGWEIQSEIAEKIRNLKSEK